MLYYLPDIKPANNQGKIRIQFIINKVRYRCAPVWRGNWSNPVHKAQADVVAAQIKADIVTGKFDYSDVTLSKYCGRNSLPNIPVSANKIVFNLVELWEKFEERQKGRVEETTFKKDYREVKSALNKLTVEQLKLDNSHLLVDTLLKHYSPRTLEKLFAHLKACGKPDYCYTLSDGLIACKRTDYGSKLPDGYAWTSKTDKDGTHYIGTEESQQRFKEQNKAQYKKSIDKTWKYSVLTINDGTYKESVKHDWHKTRKTYEDGEKDYSQYGYKKNSSEQIKKNDLTSNGEFIGLYHSFSMKLSELLNESAYLQVLRTKYLIILEGEKCVDYFNKESTVRFKSDTHIFPYFLALTSIGGAGSVSEHDIQMYRKLAEHSPEIPIVLSPDFDKPGYQHIRKIYDALKDVPNQIKIVDWTKLPSLPDKKFDMADYFEKFKETLKTQTVEEFIESLTVTPDEFGWDRFNSVESADLRLSLNIKVSQDYFLNGGFKGVNWLIDGLVAEGTSTELAAQEKTGKTCLALDLLASIYSGDDFLGRQVKRGEVLYINCDSSENTFNKQVNDRWNELNNQLDYIQDWIPTEENLKLLGTYCKEHPGLTVVVDSIKGLTYGVGIDENTPSVGNLVKSVSQVITDNNCTVIFLHHISKNKNNRGTHRSAGHHSIGSNVDQIWILEKDGNEVRHLESVGSRYTERFKISYQVGKDYKCHTTSAPTQQDDEYEYQENSVSATDTLEGQIKALLTKTDRKLTTQEIADCVGKTKQGVTKALKNADWIRSEKDGKTYVYWIEKTNRQPTTDNHHPIGELVVDVVVDAEKPI